MSEKIGRNDPCPCGSGKKYKNCCQLKAASSHKTRNKITAKWLNAPSGPNLIERTFGSAISSTGKTFEASKNTDFKKKEKTEENPS